MCPEDVSGPKHGHRTGAVEVARIRPFRTDKTSYKSPTGAAKSEPEEGAPFFRRVALKNEAFQFLPVGFLYPEQAAFGCLSVHKRFIDWLDGPTSTVHPSTCGNRAYPCSTAEHRRRYAGDITKFQAEAKSEVGDKGRQRKPDDQRRRENCRSGPQLAVE
jgi:hypothetical protein